jgi:ketosteroid isomerase-like protein
MRSRRAARIISTTILALLPTFGAAMEIVGGTQEDRAAFEQIQKNWIASCLSGDLDPLMALHDEDTTEFNDDPQELHINGDCAFLWGQFTLLGRPKAGGEEFRDAGRYFVLYKKNAAGEWRIFRDIDNVMPTP